jgi:hypothetical protein
MLALRRFRWRWRDSVLVLLDRLPLRLYETPNLQLIQAGIGSKMPAANVVRCFNRVGLLRASFLVSSASR